MEITVTHSVDLHLRFIMRLYRRSLYLALCKGSKIAMNFLVIVAFRDGFPFYK